MCDNKLNSLLILKIQVDYNAHCLDFIPICQPIRVQRSNKLRLLTGNMRLPRRRHRCMPLVPNFFAFRLGPDARMETVLPRQRPKFHGGARYKKLAVVGGEMVVARRSPTS